MRRRRSFGRGARGETICAEHQPQVFLQGLIGASTGYRRGEDRVPDDRPDPVFTHLYLPHKLPTSLGGEPFGDGPDTRPALPGTTKGTRPNRSDATHGTAGLRRRRSVDVSRPRPLHQRPSVRHVRPETPLGEDTRPPLAPPTVCGRYGPQVSTRTRRSPSVSCDRNLWSVKKKGKGVRSHIETGIVVRVNKEKISSLLNVY